MEEVGRGLEGVQVLVMAKAPVSGRVKTRLCPPLTPDGAARLAEASLRDTLDSVTGSKPTRRAIALAGPPGPWLPGGFARTEQVGRGLAERIDSALAWTWTSSALPLLLIGMDTPQLRPGQLVQAAEVLLSEGTDAVLGPATDGGYWCLGLRSPVDSPCREVPMSSDRTCERQLGRLQDLGLRCRLLPAMRDVDDIDDALAVRDQAPSSRFAAALVEVVGAAGPPRNVGSTSPAIGDGG